MRPAKLLVLESSRTSVRDIVHAIMGSRNHWGPFVILIVTLSSLLIFRNSKNGFEPNHYGNLSSHGITIARNLLVGPGVPFMFERSTVTDDGRIEYKPYNRFPVFPFLLISLAIAPFESDLVAQIYAARQVMNGFMVLAALLCFLLVQELINDNYKALLVTLAVFSTHYLLSYADMIFNDVPAIAGFLLAALLAVRCQKRRMSVVALIIIPVLSVATGWQPLAVYLSWLVIAIGSAARDKSFSLHSVLREPAFMASVSAVVAATLILAAQLFSEWRIIGGQFQELATVKSLLWRVGLGSEQGYAPHVMSLTWLSFAKQQAIRVVRSVIPYTSLFFGIAYWKPLTAGLGTALVAIVCYGLIRRSERPQRLSTIRMLLPSLGILVLSGLAWSIPMRYFVVFHDFQAMFYIGSAIAFFVLAAVAYSPKRSIAVPLSVILFVVSAYQATVTKSAGSFALNSLTAEFQNIRNVLPAHSLVHVDVDSARFGVGYNSVDFYLAGNSRTTSRMAKYFVSEQTTHPGLQLTKNSRINLFILPELEMAVPAQFNSTVRAN